MYFRAMVRVNKALPDKKLVRHTQRQRHDDLSWNTRPRRIALTSTEKENIEQLQLEDSWQSKIPAQFSCRPIASRLPEIVVNLNSSNHSWFIRWIIDQSSLVNTMRKKDQPLPPISDIRTYWSIEKDKNRLVLLRKGDKENTCGDSKISTYWICPDSC
ncbi:hypothetical protein BDR03DRAFT_1000646 [Suillus americanus]|nr:hypothetical protein BDR03DRAFT_1000646 [Suillus americanus]